MGHDAKAWRRLRYEFVEAAAKYDEYETFIERNETSEDWYCNNGRYSTIGRIRWPYGSYRKCWILAPFSGENEKPFSVMKTLFGKAWLWLPRDIANNAIDTAELHLSDPLLTTENRALWWVKSDYQHWCWLLWFHWQRQLRVEHPKEAAKPSPKLVLSPFHCSADLIAQWGLDGSDGKIPEWLSPLTSGTEPQPTFIQLDEATNTPKDATKAKDCTVICDGLDQLIAAPTQHDDCAEASCPNQEPDSNNEPAKLAKVSVSTASEFFSNRSDEKTPEWLSPPTPDSEQKPPSNQHEDSTRTTKAPTKPKRSTERGEGREKLIGALTKHHKYADGSCMNGAAVGNNQLAKLAGVSVSTASEFFTKQFGGHKKYIALCSDLTRLIAALKLLNQEFQPHILFGDNPPEEAVNPDFKGDRRRKPRASELGRDTD